MGSASVALKKITPLYISGEKITVMSAMPLRQSFETGDLEAFSNLDLNQIRILKTVQDQVQVMRYHIWDKDVFPYVQLKVESGFSIYGLTVHKEQVKQIQNNLLPFSISFVFPIVTTLVQNESSSYHTLLPYGHFRNSYFTTTSVMSS